MPLGAWDFSVEGLKVRFPFIRKEFIVAPLKPRTSIIGSLAPGAMLLLLAVGAFTPSLVGPYIFDDKVLVSGNDYVHDLAHFRHWFRASLADSNYDPAQNEAGLDFWRPLVLATFALNWTIGGGEPAWFHATNLLLHGANVLLLWSLLRSWFRVRGLAWGLAAVFALHPAQSEVVCWISGRGDSLCCFGLLVSLHGVRMLPQHSTRGMILSVLGALIAFLSKEMAVVLPALVLTERWARHPEANWRRFVAREKWPLLAAVLVTVGYLTLRAFVLPTAPSSPAHDTIRRLPFVFETLGRCLELVLWPANTTLGQAITRSVDGIDVARTDYAAVGGLFLASGTAVSWRSRTRAPGIAVGWICFLVTWLPVSGLVSHRQLALISPRYLYIPLIPLLFALGSAVEALARTPGRRLELLLPRLGVPILMALGLTSFRRSQDYASSQAFWKAEILANPNYIAAQDFFVVRELAQKRPASALKLARHFLASNLKAGYRSLNEGLEFHIIRALAASTPDADRKTLGALSRFCDDIVQRKPSVLRLPEKDTVLQFDQADAERLEWYVRRRSLLLESADFLSRLGYDDAAAERLEHALTDCEKCWLLHTQAALVRARARDFEGALALSRAFDRYGDPRRRGELHARLARALELAPVLSESREAPAPEVLAYLYQSLDAFGRAYELLRPVYSSPPSEPTAQKELALLALQAGHLTKARTMAELFLPPEEVQRFLELGPAPWRDAARPPSLWIPDVPSSP